MIEEKLVLDNINLIYYVLKKYNLYKKLDEYYDIGLIGLIKGVKNFDASKGYAISTYLTKCISMEVLAYLNKLCRAKRGGGKEDISIYQSIKSDGKELFLIDTIPSNENIEENAIKNEQLEMIYKAISNLNDRDKFIICSFYGLLDHDELTQHEIANILEITQSYVSRIIKKFNKNVRRSYE